VVKLSAVNTAAPASATLTFQGTSAGLSHSAQATLNVNAVLTAAHSPLRTQYLRTNSFYDADSLQFAPPHFSVYDSVHNQFFVSNPYMNEIDVFDAAKEIQTGQIPVPMAWGIDVSPYNGNLYAATLFGDVYQIDTAKLTVIKRYPSASIGPNGYVATEAFVLSDGRLALLGFQSPLLGFVNGAINAAVWDPITNSLDTGTDGSICPFSHIGAFAVSGDRTRVLATYNEESAAAPICVYDPVAKVTTNGSLPTPVGSLVREIIPTPDGKRFFLTTALQGVAVFDAKTAQLLGQITGPSSYSGIPNAAMGAVMSLDGKTLYLVDQETGDVGAFDTTTFTQTGWVIGLSVVDLEDYVVAAAIDATGLIIGPTGHGVAFLDASKLKATEPIDVRPGLPLQTSGPETGGTVLSDFAFSDPNKIPTLSQIYVGNTPGLSPSLALLSGTGYAAQATTPPSLLLGPVDLTMSMSDGGVAIAPEGFSYGPSILEVVSNGATSEGGQTGTIVGYGFGSSKSAIQVTVGGNPAPIASIYPHPLLTPFPFPLDAVQFTIPPGSAGSVEDVTVTTPSGTTTAAGAFHYVPVAETYPGSANLQAGIYDARRDLYYFTDTTQVAVLSRSAKKWLSPISLPGVTGATRLQALSESPDGSKLAVSDLWGGAIYVLDPDNPAGAKRFQMPSMYVFNSPLTPSGLAITNNGMVYFQADDPAKSSFHKLDTATGTVTAVGAFLPAESNAPLTRVLISPDGSQIYGNSTATAFRVQTANDQVTIAPAFQDGSGIFPELMISGDGSTTGADGYITDATFGIETAPAYIDWETWFATSVDGQKLNQDGSILYQPLTDGIDLIARNTGRLFYRVQIPVTPASVYDPLVVAGGQNTVGVITANGVSFLDLSSLPIAAEYTQPFLATTNTEVGTQAHPQSATPSGHALSSLERLLSARPRLRHRLEQPQFSPKTPES
jgi:hypothetical protein